MIKQVINRINKNKIIRSKSFEYKTKLIGSTPNNNNTLDTDVVIPLKYLSNFRRFFDLSLINGEIELDLSWSKEYVISEISKKRAVQGNPDAGPPVPAVATMQATGATFQINNAKLYVPVVTLSINGNITFLEGFNKKIAWKKYSSEIRTKTKNNNLNYLIDPIFRNINRLFVLSFKNGSDDPMRNSFD